MAVETFKKFIAENGINVEIILTEEPTHTAQAAAETHDLPVSNIVKSLLVKADDNFILCLVPGDRRLDFDWLKSHVAASEIRMANADEVKRVTGYSIGGVPPFGHTSKLKTFVIDGFNENEQLVAAAGASNAVFKISLERLKTIVQ